MSLMLLTSKKSSVIFSNRHRRYHLGLKFLTRSSSSCTCDPSYLQFTGLCLPPKPVGNWAGVVGIYHERDPSSASCDAGVLLAAGISMVATSLAPSATRWEPYNSSPFFSYGPSRQGAVTSSAKSPKGPRKALLAFCSHSIHSKGSRGIAERVVSPLRGWDHCDPGPGSYLHTLF